MALVQSHARCSLVDDSLVQQIGMSISKRGYWPRHRIFTSWLWAERAECKLWRMSSTIDMACNNLPLAAPWERCPFVVGSQHHLHAKHALA
jgi:hypothetical protein